MAQAAGGTKEWYSCRNRVPKVRKSLERRTCAMADSARCRGRRFLRRRGWISPVRARQGMRCTRRRRAGTARSASSLTIPSRSRRVRPVAARRRVVQPKVAMTARWGCGVHLGGRGAHDPGLRQPSHHIVGMRGAPQDPREPHAQSAVAAEDVTRSVQSGGPRCPNPSAVAATRLQSAGGAGAARAASMALVDAEQVLMMVLCGMVVQVARADPSSSAVVGV